MNLAIDIGNTNIKAALFDSDKLVQLAIGEEQVLGLLGHKPAYCIISKTGRNDTLQDAIAAIGVSAIYFSPLMELPITNKYATPGTLGPDRLALTVAASALFPQQPVLAIDSGTCITYNFVSAEGAFLGGSITPGVDMRFRAMHEFTAALPLLVAEKDMKHDLIGIDTQSSMQSGALNGVLAEVDGIINLYKARYANLQIVVTGGSLTFFERGLENSIFAQPHLVLQGLNRILLFNTKAK
jgi:type III pantothenate kinase